MKRDGLEFPFFFCSFLLVSLSKCICLYTRPIQTLHRKERWRGGLWKELKGSKNTWGGKTGGKTLAGGWAGIKEGWSEWRGWYEWKRVEGWGRLAAVLKSITARSGGAYCAQSGAAIPAFIPFFIPLFRTRLCLAVRVTSLCMCGEVFFL